MRVEPQIFSFEFEAMLKTKPDRNPRNDKPHEESEAVDTLNKNSDDISLELEKEIRRLFRSSVTVQAEISFEEGSIIATGAIVIIKWLGPVALAAAKTAVETEFSTAIKIVIKRVLQRWLGSLVSEFHAVVGELEVNSQGTGSLAEPASSPAWSRKTRQSWSSPTLLVVANTVMLLLLLIIELLVIFKQIRL